MRGDDVRGMLRSVGRGLRLGLLLPLAWTMKLYGGTDKISHGYGRLYGRHFRRFRLRSFTLLEIGVFKGDSLRVWRDVFPRASIVGMDIEPPDVHFGPRVRVVFGDQSSVEDIGGALAGLPAPLLVIDDGSHRGDDIWATFRHVFPRMASGGIYIIEDLSTSYWTEFGGGVPAPGGSAVGLAKELVDAVQSTAPIHSWWGGASAERPAPIVEFDGVAAIHVVPNALIIERS